MKDKVKELRKLMETNPNGWVNILSRRIDNYVEKSRKKKGLPVDNMRRYRYHLMPETPREIVACLYGMEVAEEVLADYDRVDECWFVEDDSDETCSPETRKLIERIDDRWEQHFRAVDKDFVREQYGAWGTEVADAVMDVCLLSMHRLELKAESAEKLAKAVATIESAFKEDNDFRLWNVLQAGIRKQEEDNHTSKPSEL